MQNENIIHLNRIKIEEYQEKHPEFFLAIKRISEEEGFLIFSSYSKIDQYDIITFCAEEETFPPEEIEAIPAKTPILSLYEGFSCEDIWEE